jgi:hypothetical protein
MDKVVEAESKLDGLFVRVVINGGKGRASSEATASCLVTSVVENNESSTTEGVIGDAAGVILAGKGVAGGFREESPPFCGNSMWLLAGGGAGGSIEESSTMSGTADSSLAGGGAGGSVEESSTFSGTADLSLVAGEASKTGFVGTYGASSRRARLTQRESTPRSGNRPVIDGGPVSEPVDAEVIAASFAVSVRAATVFSIVIVAHAFGSPGDGEGSEKDGSLLIADNTDIKFMNSIVRWYSQTEARASL